MYDAAGQPLPDADGSFLRASTLYRWLSNGVRELTRRCNWLVQDWTAMAQEPRQQVYNLDRRFVNVDGVFVNQYRLLYLDELHTIYPSFSVAQPLWFSWHHRSDHLELSLWPAPDRTEPRPNLMVTLDPLSSVIALSSTAGFLPFGYVQIQNEIILYSALTTDLHPTAQPGIQVVRRGTCGTQAAFHFAGTPVQHLSIWARGSRVPSAVTKSTDCVEVSFAWQAPLESYVLAKVREAEQDRQAAMSHMQEFTAFCNEIQADPGWQQTPWPSQARAYGSSTVGALYFGRVVVP